MLGVILLFCEGFAARLRAATRLAVKEMDGVQIKKMAFLGIPLLSQAVVYLG
jgi:hypothetical protein